MAGEGDLLEALYEYAALSLLDTIELNSCNSGRVGLISSTLMGLALRKLNLS